MSLLPLILLLALLGAAVWHDVRARRIPNAIVFPGALAAIALHAVLPAGAGLFGTPMGGLGSLSALGGLGLGLAFLLPMYALRLMGAGDVKLLAMVGAFVGAGQILAIALVTLVAGGVLALAFAAAHGKLRQLTANAVQMMVPTSMAAAGGELAVAQPAAASGRLPYAIAIAAATVPCVLQLRLPELAAHLKVNVSVIDPLIAFLRTEKLCDVAGIGASGTAKSVNQGVPITQLAPESPLSVALLAMARELTGAAAPQQPAGLMNRLFKRTAKAA